MPFKKGQSGNPAGKLPGTKNKNYLNVNMWLELIWERLPKMTFDQQVANSWRAVDALLPKVPSLPATPGDSAANAAKVFETMNGYIPPPTPLESQGNGLESNNGTNGLNGGNGLH